MHGLKSTATKLRQGCDTFKCQVSIDEFDLVVVVASS